jgi:hypothetical protein
MRDDGLAASAEGLGCPSWGGWVKKECCEADKAAEREREEETMMRDEADEAAEREREREREEGTTIRDEADEATEREREREEGTTMRDEADEAAAAH